MRPHKPPASSERSSSSSTFRVCSGCVRASSLSSQDGHSLCLECLGSAHFQMMISCPHCQSMSLSRRLERARRLSWWEKSGRLMPAPWIRDYMSSHEILPDYLWKETLESLFAPPVVPGVVSVLSLIRSLRFRTKLVVLAFWEYPLLLRLLGDLRSHLVMKLFPLVQIVLFSWTLRGRISLCFPRVRARL